MHIMHKGKLMGNIILIEAFGHAYVKKYRAIIRLYHTLKI